MRIVRYLRHWTDRLFGNEEGLFLFILLLVSLVVLVFLGATLAPLLAALIFAFLLQGLVLQLIRLSVPRQIAIHLTFLCFIGLVSIFLLIFIPLIVRQFNSFVATLPTVVVQMQSLMQRLPEIYPTLINQDQVASWIDFIALQLQQAGQWLLGASINILPNLFTLIIYLVLVPILVYFMLRDSEELIEFVRSLLPNRQQLINVVGREMSKQISNYIRGKAIEIVIVGVATYVCFLLLGLDYALVLSLLVGFSVLIPFIGAAVVTVPVALVGFLQWGIGSELAWVLVVYGIIQLLDGNVLVPILFSDAVNLHPVTIIAAVLLFGGLWGVWGVFFSIPLASLVKVLYQVWPTISEEEINKEEGDLFFSLNSSNTAHED